MPAQIVIEIAPAEQARLLAQLRRARRGHWRALHILVLLTLHHSPSEIAAVLLCARSTGYAVARDWQRGGRGPEPVRPSGPPCFTPSLRRSLLALLKKSPSAYGWCRTRWSCAPLALQLEVQRGFRVSAETVRRCYRRWTGFGSGPNWRRKTTTRSGPPNSPESVVFSRV